MFYARAALRGCALLFGAGMKTLARAVDVQEIRARLAALTSEDARRWGEMSVEEMVCHVREAFRTGAGERASARLKVGLPPRVVKWLALWFPRPWPHGVPTIPELRVGGEGLRPGRFEADREELLRAMDRFLAIPDNRTEHAIFGRMRHREWMRWGYLHTDHHLRQFGR